MFFFGRPEYTTSPDVGTEKEEFQKGLLTTAVHYCRCSYHITSDFRERQGGVLGHDPGGCDDLLVSAEVSGHGNMFLYSEKTY